MAVFRVNSMMFECTLLPVSKVQPGDMLLSYLEEDRDTSKHFSVYLGVVESKSDFPGWGVAKVEAAIMPHFQLGHFVRIMTYPGWDAQSLLFQEGSVLYKVLAVDGVKV